MEEQIKKIYEKQKNGRIRMIRNVLLIYAALICVVSIFKGNPFPHQETKNRVSAYVDKTVTTSSLDLSLCVSGAGIDDKGNMQTNGINTIDDTIEQRVSVLNSGEKAQYVRVKISKDNWVNINLINKDDWIVPDNHTDSENVYVYYNKVLNPGERTPELMDSIILFDSKSENTNKYSGKTININWDAEAVQTVAAGDAMLTEWGVEAELGDDGSLKAVSDR